jgi:nitric oxide reductase NorD protein
MGWDETVFGWLWGRGRTLIAPRASPEVLARRVRFDALAERLRTVAIAVAGGPVTLREAEAEGGISGNVISLPAWLDFAPSHEENERAYVIRTALAASIVRLGLANGGALDGPVEQALATVIATSTAKTWLTEELPASVDALDALAGVMRAARVEAEDDVLEHIVRAGLGAEPSAMARRILACRPSSAKELTSRARDFAREIGPARRPAAVPLWGWLTPRTSAASESTGDDGASLPSGTERTIRARDHVTRKTLERRPEQESPLVHSFEKLHTLEEHGGGNKRADGSDELDAHAEALDELDLREVIRSDEDTRSLLRCDAMIESGAGDLAAGPPSDRGLPYDEWDEAKRRFRPAWCRVHVSAIEERLASDVAERAVAGRLREIGAHVDAVRAELAHLEMLRRPRSRQIDGPDVDDDAMVDRHAALCAGATPPDRLFRSALRHRPDLAVLLLVDTSLSTDGWVEGQRILDAERDATLVLAEALDGSIDELAIAGFSSHTRADCRFIVMKDWRERWRGARHRVMSLAPAGYTRIGPAMRHATRLLEGRAARRRLLLVVTDGKPNDYDRYEGRHGVLDVAHATLEAGIRGVHVHALATDESARQHLPRMFGNGRFSVVRSPRDLAQAMGRAVVAMQR